MSSTMNFRQRLLRYLIGMALGLGLVFVFFGPRGCGKWLPGRQVKKWIKENNQNIEISPKATCLMKCQGLNVDDVIYTLGEEGKVLFNESQTKGYPKTYIIRAEKPEDMTYKVGFTLREDSSSVVAFTEKVGQLEKCNCPEE